MKCYLCGSDISSQDRFCARCGEKNVHFQENPQPNPDSVLFDYDSEYRPTYQGAAQKPSATSAKVVAIYSLVLGILNLISNLSSGATDFIVYVILGLMIGFSIAILNLVKRGDYKEKGFIITLFVIYCLAALGGFVILMTPLEMIPIPGLAEMKFLMFFIVEAIILTPFIFSIRYMVQSAKGK
ncbi:MAG: hypothetical protein WBH29_06545 [Bacilli bacterium]|jgi:hypothetical protein